MRVSELPDIPNPPLHDEVEPLALGLKKTLAKIQSLRRRQSKTHLELLRAIREVTGKNARQRRAILVEAGLGSVEALRLLRSAKVDADFNDLIVREACPPDVIDAILTSRKDVQHFAVRRLESGHAVERRDLSALRTAINSSKPGAEYRRNAQLVKAEAQRTAAARLASFREQVGTLVQMMLALDSNTNSDDDGQIASDEIVELATQVRTGLPAFFDTAQVEIVSKSIAEADRLGELPVRPRTSDQASDKEASAWEEGDIRLAEAVAALNRLANRDFWRAESADPDFDREIEFELIRCTAWLAGDDLSRVERSMDEKRNHVQGNAIDFSQSPLTSLEFCAGAGGEAIGLHAAGFTPIGVFERDADAVNTLVANNVFGPLHCVDIKDVDFKPYIGKVDVVCGGVPCQPFSSSGHRMREKDKRDLFTCVAEIVKMVRPKAVMLENVLGFAVEANTHYRADIATILQDAGYSTRLVAMRASDYGLAQNRPRVVLLAFRDGYMARFKMPPIFKEWRTTVGEALVDLMSCNGWQGATAWARAACDVGPTITGAAKGKSQGFAAFNQVLDWSNLGVSARTIAERSPMGDDPIETMPGLTLRMGARLQGFPDNWRFMGSEIERRCQIANAFPPIMAAAIGLAIREALTGVRQDYRSVLERLRFLQARDSRPDTDFEENVKSCGSFGSWYHDHHAIAELSDKAVELDVPLGDILEPRRSVLPAMRFVNLRRHFGASIPSLQREDVPYTSELPSDWYASKGLADPPCDDQVAKAASA